MVGATLEFVRRDARGQSKRLREGLALPASVMRSCFKLTTKRLGATESKSGSDFLDGTLETFVKLVFERAVYSGVFLRRSSRPLTSSP